MARFKKQNSGPETPDDDGEGQSLACYRVLRPCRIGRYREAGELIWRPLYERCPEHLELLLTPPDPESAQETENAFAVTDGPVPASVPAKLLRKPDLAESRQIAGLTPAELFGTLAEGK